MSELSDDGSSSDSSTEFLVPCNKIDLNSSYFKQSDNKKVKPKKSKQLVFQESSDEDDDEFDNGSNDVSSSDLLAQVLKNLENAKNQSFPKAPPDNEPQASSSSVSQYDDSKKDDISNEINNLLMQGESKATLTKEETRVEIENDGADAQKEYVIPQKGVQIHLPGENLMLIRQKKKQLDIQKVLQSKINQGIRKSQVFVHKVGLLINLAHGFHLNKLANDPDLLGMCLSMMSQNNYPNGRIDLKYLEKFTKWFISQFKIFNKHKEEHLTIDLLMQRQRERKIFNYLELVLLYIATVRGMGCQCRLVISLLPPPLKPKKEQLFNIPTDDNDKSSKSSTKKSTDDKTSKAKASKKPSSKKETEPKIKSRNAKGKKPVSPSKNILGNSPEDVKLKNIEARKRAALILKNAPTEESPKKSSEIDNKESNTESENRSNVIPTATKLRNTLEKFKRTAKAKINSSKSDESFTRKQTSNDENSEIEESDEDSGLSTDDEFTEKNPKKKSKPAAQNTTTKVVNKPNNRAKVLSSDDELCQTAFNVWAEVYVESEESWISVDVLEKKIHCVSEIFKKAGDPVLYIVAWNSTGSIKDVTRRYSPNWLTVTRKKRVEEKWWDETLKSWKEKKTAMSKAENDQLLQRELEQPLPTTLAACKGHPLYVITRHLLKFEALYPPDCVPLGHLKTGEAIYSRHCVHTLYSRETWVRRARVVKPNQEAYKIVKSMPKYDKLSGMKIKDQPLELFGKWQTTPYIPPDAKDGIVPRNEYGNVDLFKMCMLPKGCVYINLPALNRVARKMNIDCAPACVGFNFGARGALPAFEGFVVCEEYEDTLRDAWEEDQAAAQKRAEEKHEKRIYGNWKKLIKGLLIREKLALKYNFKEKNEEVSNQKKTKSNAEKKVLNNKPGTSNKTVTSKSAKQQSESESEHDELIQEKTKSKLFSKTREINAKKQALKNKKPPTMLNSLKNEEDSDYEFEVDDDGEIITKEKQLKSNSKLAENPIEEPQLSKNREELSSKLFSKIREAKRSIQTDESKRPRLEEKQKEEPQLSKNREEVSAKLFSKIREAKRLKQTDETKKPEVSNTFEKDKNLATDEEREHNKPSLSEKAIEKNLPSKTAKVSLSTKEKVAKTKPLNLNDENPNTRSTRSSSKRVQEQSSMTNKKMKS